MKEIRQSILRALPPLKLYEDELRDLWSFLSANCEGPITVKVSRFELDDIEEIRELPEEESHWLTITCTAPYLEVRLTPVSGEIYCGDGSLEAEGIVNRITEILERGSVRRLALPDKWWFSALLGVPLGIGVALKNAEVAAFGLLLLVLFWAIGGYELFWKTRRYTTVIFKRRKESPSFWGRNKDKLYLILIGAIVGSLVTLSMTLLKDFITQNP